LERGGEQLIVFVGRERMQLDSFRELVFPQGDNRIGRLFAGPEGGEYENLFRGSQQLREGGRGLIEQVSIVDEDCHWLALTAPDDRIGDSAQHLHRSVLGAKSGTTDAKAPNGSPAAH
jgi:hypothetical protein